MAYVNLGQVVYPVGSVYISYTSISPANLFGGNWTAITGHFPYFNAGTVTGGANSVSHSHGLSNGYGQFRYDGASGAYSNIQVGFKNVNWTQSNGWLMEWHGSSVSRVMRGALNQGTNNVGMQLAGTSDSSSINNMPAYQTFYAWRRTS